MLIILRSELSALRNAMQDMQGAAATYGLLQMSGAAYTHEKAAAPYQHDTSPVTLQGRDLAARQAAKEAMAENAELVRQKTDAAATARRRNSGRPATAAPAIQGISEVSLTRLARMLFDQWQWARTHL
jgi:hypothetical protein